MSTITGMLTGSKLRALRAMRGITQADLAAKAGVDAKAIAQFETGKRELRTDTVRKLCEALQVTVTYHVAGEGDISGP